MRFDILTIFPSFFEAPLLEGLLARGRKEGLLDFAVHDLRRWAVDRHRSIDDEAYGGGAGMVFIPEPVIAAVDEVSNLPDLPSPRRIFLSPQGKPLDAARARSLAFEPRLLLLCARYEGVDERVLDAFDWEEISIGDVVVMGGEAPALVLVEAVSRFVPGVVGAPDSVRNDSFERGLLDHPHYTRPVEFRGMRVPDVLLSGHHERIRAWRFEQALAATLRKRPDLLEKADLDDEARALLERLRSSEAGLDPAGAKSSG